MERYSISVTRCVQTRLSNFADETKTAYQYSDEYKKFIFEVKSLYERLIPKEMWWKPKPELECERRCRFGNIQQLISSMSSR